MNARAYLLPKAIECDGFFKGHRLVNTNQKKSRGHESKDAAPNRISAILYCMHSGDHAKISLFCLAKKSESTPSLECGIPIVSYG